MFSASRGVKIEWVCLLGFIPGTVSQASDAPVAQTARATLIGRYGDAEPAQSDVIVALGGDGFMLRTLHDTQHLDVPVYGMNRGTIGFLMNEYSETDLLDRLSETEEEVINPLSMRARDRAGRDHAALAINEVSLLRAGPQAAWLKITVDGRVRMAELVCDGALLATPVLRAFGGGGVVLVASGMALVGAASLLIAARRNVAAGAAGVLAVAMLALDDADLAATLTAYRAERRDHAASSTLPPE